MNYLGMKSEEMSKTVDLLNDLLANYHVYYQNLRNFHWNVHGPHFFELHSRFEELYHDAREAIDSIAERIRTLRSRPLSTLKEYLRRSVIKEPEKVTTDMEMVRTILSNHRVLINKMRYVLGQAAEVGDEGTVDLVSGFLNALEKKSWMLDAWTVPQNQEVAPN
ncbi:MAG: DNA starvation/stationary phase protection protein [Bacteroidetes bacterium]|nr:MAG: DNA starvation/stationary phase protection protein [Bacteroidota bacterium]